MFTRHIGFNTHFKPFADKRVRQAINYAILLEAALSFLGLGTQPPNPSWGGMLATARDQFFTTPWISVFPGVAIFVTVLGLNLFGDGLRDILDPHVTRK